MATTYALPLNGAAAYSQGSLGHGHPHRKAASLRTSMPFSLNSVLADEANSSHVHASHPSHKHSPSLPLKSWTDTRLETKSPAFIPSIVDQSPRDSLHHDLVSNEHIPSQPHNLLKMTAQDLDTSIVDEGSSSRVWISKSEFLASILIPLPYALTALILISPMPASSLDPTTETLLKAGAEFENLDRPIVHTPLLNLSTIFLLTGATLLLVGFYGRATSTRNLLDRRRYAATGNLIQGLVQPLQTTITPQRVLSKALAVGLPYYATSKLGGARVAMVLLVAIAAGLANTNGKRDNLTQPDRWRKTILLQKWSIGSLALQMLADASGFAGASRLWQIMLGYFALGVSIFVIPLPYPTATIKSSSSSVIPRKQSSLVSSLQDSDITIVSGASTAILGIVLYPLSSTSSTGSASIALLSGFLSSCIGAFGLISADAVSLKSKMKTGLAIGLCLPLIFQGIFDTASVMTLVFRSILAVASWFGVYYDTQLAAASHAKQFHRRRSNTATSPAHTSLGTNWKMTEKLIDASQDWPILHSILKEPDSRSVFFFMILNFSFMGVQMFYAIITGSLGLLSDSIHMFFDCLALLVGLCAAVMSKWPPSLRFPYGFGKMNTLSGFANGVFLMLISIEIIWEAVERLMEGAKMQRIGELLVVSCLGFAVNMIGLFSFGHHHHDHDDGHGHGHGPLHGAHDHSHTGLHEGHGHHHNHSHDHSSEEHTQSPHAHHCSHGHSAKDDHDHVHGHENPPLSPLMHNHQSRSPNPQIHLASLPNSPAKIPQSSPLRNISRSHPSPPPAAQSHGHSHFHSHDHHSHNENMHGIFLHVLADALGSVAVIASTIMIHYTGWAGFDPLASLLIAILIFASAVPLVTSSAKRLLLAIPSDVEFDMRDLLAGVSGLKGVVGVNAPRFWLGEGGGSKVQGTMHMVVAKGEGLEDVRERAVRFCQRRGVDVLVHVERDGDGRCWCGVAG